MNSIPTSSASALGVVKGEPAANGHGLPPPAARPRVAAARPPAGQQWWQLASAAARHWHWILLTAALGVAAGIYVGQKLWGATHTATAQLVRYDTPDPRLFQPRAVNPATLVGMVGSAELRARVGAKLQPAQSEGELAGRVRVTPVPTTDLVNVAVTADDPETATALANLYATEAVAFTQAMQGRDAKDAASYLRKQLADLEAEAAEVNAKVTSAVPAAPVSGVSTTQQARLDAARGELSDLQARYTDAHPLVQMQQARVAAIEAQMGAAPAAPEPAAAAAGAISTGDLEMLRERSRTLEGQRRDLSARLQVTEMLAEKPPGHYQVFSPAVAERAGTNSPMAKIAIFAAFLGLCGAIVGVLASMTDEIFDRRLRTPADVRRVTGLPVIARLGKTDRMSEEEKVRWAFRTWTALQSRLSPTPNQGLVCGITSSSNGEGRSAWLRLLADAATQCGFRVAVITTQKSEQAESARAHVGRPAPASAASNVRFRSSNGAPRAAEPVIVHETMLDDDLLSEPDAAIERMLSEDGPSVVQIPLPGWVWNLEHRKEWLTSLNAWSAHENTVVLVELPPASTPEAVLLAQNLPNVLWLSDSTKADALETSRQIETLRLARVPLVGAVINRSSGKNLNERFARWVPAPAMAALALAGLLAFAPQAQAQEASAAEAGTFSIVSPQQRANWQQQLTLGPGDVLRIALYGDTPGTQAEVAVQPDGRLSFLEARDVVANGLTIDELRAELDRELGNFRRSARTMVSPVAFRSKKYHMLGLVSQKGAFTLDRPMTVVEAVARARGFETSAASGDVLDVADLRHAFLVRNGQRMNVDFAKLFTAGDLSQNIAVEPGDYFYFPPAMQREVYVLGEVRRPGPALLGDDSTSLRAIATTGGFTDKAWRGRVLVVRGSLAEPTPYIVNLQDVLEGKSPDIQLEPRDIVYVSARPWWKAEQLLDEAASAFTQAFVVYWTSDNVIPVTPLRSNQ